MTKDVKGIIVGLIGVACFSLTLPMTRTVIPYLDPIFIGLGRAAVAGILSLFILLILRQVWPTKLQIARLIVVAAGVVAGFPLFSSWAMLYTDASHGGVVLGVLPLATAIVGVIIARERPVWLFWVVAVCGCTTSVVYALLKGAGEFNVADFALVGAIITAAIGYAEGARLAREMGGWQVICWALVISLPVVTPLALIYMPNSFTLVPNDIWLAFLYLAVISQLVGFFFWYQGLAIGGIAKVSQVQLLQPFMTIIAATLMLGEKMDSVSIVFAVVIAILVGIGRRMPVPVLNEKTI